ncbi:MAG: phage NrS-1 polymerase family protein, partial [Gaiellaceae bacterium]
MDAGNYNGEGAASAAPIPAELRARDQWVCWKYETRDGKPTKVPFTSFGAMASSTDPATWFDFETCSSSANGFDGAGYFFSADDPFTGIDFDSCLEDGKLHPEVAALVATLDSYTEISPSGTGVKVIVRATKNVERCRTGKTEWGGVFEVYDRERYFTITGNALTGTPATIEDRQSQLDEVLRRVFGEPKPPATTHTTPVAGGFQGEEKDLIERACRAKNGARFERLWNGDTSGHNDDDSAADLALVAMLAFWTGCDPERIDSLFRQSGLMRDKWLRDDYRERTITKAITECDDVYRGGEVIDLTEYVASVNGSTIEDVDGAELLDELVSHYRRFMVMTEAQTDVVALFTVMTYCVRAFTVVPYLRVDSPTKRTGKSRLLELLEFTVQAPLKTGGVSEAALFRSLND